MANFLVVDDASIMRINMARILKELGHKVVAEADNGHMAFVQYKKYQNNIDIVTMDITMPETNGVEDGIESAKKIIEFDPTAKVVMVTSHSEQQKVLNAIKAGAANYLVKPVKKEKLETVIAKVLKK
jgi:two-component system chemotaxis response regulator CheY